jgi:DMSO/TMAO reductase YedYZ heme-binding membrane subunit
MFWWMVTRASGVAALMLASASVGIGVSMGGRFLRVRTADLRVAHEALSLAAMVALAVHASALVVDGYVDLGVADVTIPFASSYKTLWVTLGIAGGWLFVLLGLSSYVRHRIGIERWKRLHRWTMLAWVLGVAHAVGIGTDAGAGWFVVSLGAVVLPAAAMVGLRLSGASQATFSGR